MNLLDLYDAQKPAPYILGGIREEFIEESWFDNIFRSGAKQTVETGAKGLAKGTVEKITKDASDLVTEGIETAFRKTQVGTTQTAAKELAEKTARETLNKAKRDTVQQALKDAGPDGIRDAGRKFLRESAEKALRETGEISEEVIKEAGEKAVREATAESLTEAGEKAIRESIGKTIDEVGEKVIRDAVQNAMDTSAESILRKGISATGKNSDSLIDTARVVGKSTTKNAWESFKNMGKRLGKGAKAASQEMIDFARKHPYMTVGGITLITLLAIAADRFIKMNGREFPITSVKKKGPNFMEIVFTSDTNLVEEDSIEILSCDAEPSLVGKTFVIDDVTNTTTIIIRSDLKLTKDGTTGTFRYTTDFGSSFRATTREAIKGVTGTLKEGIREVAGAAGDIGGAAFSGLWEGLGLPEFGSLSNIISIVGALFLLSSMFLVYRNLTK